MSNDRTDVFDAQTGAYPPARLGLRGSHPGAFEIGHRIPDGERFEVDDLPVEETPDLVVAGAGISGLAAAWFFRQRRPTARERFRAGREVMLAMTLEDFESRIRDELTRMLGPGGFDAERDIAAIVVNRWGHGYSYSGDPLLEERSAVPPTWEVARARAGSVAIANSDSGWMPFAHAAIDQAHRAVGELLDDARTP